MSSNKPALPPPPGVTSDPNNPLPTIWLVSCVLMAAISTLFVVLRFYVKIRILKQYNRADALCILGWLFLIAYLGAELAQLNNGVGTHGWEVTREQYSSFARGINQVQIFYMPGIFFVKASILVQFADFFVTQSRSPRWWTLWGIIVANAVFFTILLFLEIFECWPREKIWNPTIPGRCIDINQTFVATGALNVLDDFLILILPLFWIWRLHMRGSRKLGIAAVFATGLFACVCSVLRLKESIVALSSPDITYSLVPIALWASAELASGLIVACLPVLPRLFRTATVPKTQGSGGHSDYNGTKAGRIPLSTYRARYEGISDDKLLETQSGPEMFVYSSSQRPRPAGAETGGPPVPYFTRHGDDPDSATILDLQERKAGVEHLHEVPAVHREGDMRQSSDRR